MPSQPRTETIQSHGIRANRVAVMPGNVAALHLNEHLEYVSGQTSTSPARPLHPGPMPVSETTAASPDAWPEI